MKKSLILLLLLGIFPQISLANTVVRIENPENGQRGTGFFFSLKDDKLTKTIATNAHVCVSNYADVVKKKAQAHHPKLVTIRLPTEQHTVSGLITKLDILHDICVIEAEHLHAVGYRVTDFPIEYDTGDVLFLIPFNSAELPLAYLQKDQTKDVWTNYHQDSYIFKGYSILGMSGSPILDDFGEVQFILWATGNENQLTFAISAKHLKTLVEGG